ncbi:hypothetical protein V498_00250 [Pseudogymnoascus sp. VKM F-4517 (FW-2822)]|nr:hypothetical protein V498_00250 [Pseudogymnoascus sp. VKM F-4517 (FW-2822)]
MEDYQHESNKRNEQEKEYPGSFLLPNINIGVMRSVRKTSIPMKRKINSLSLQSRPLKFSLLPLFHPSQSRPFHIEKKDITRQKKKRLPHSHQSQKPRFQVRESQHAHHQVSRPIPTYPVLPLRRTITQQSPATQDVLPPPPPLHPLQPRLRPRNRALLRGSALGRLVSNTVAVIVAIPAGYSSCDGLPTDGASVDDV